MSGEEEVGDGEEERERRWVGMLAMLRKGEPEVLVQDEQMHDSAMKWVVGWEETLWRYQGSEEEKEDATRPSSVRGEVGPIDGAGEGR